EPLAESPARADEAAPGRSWLCMRLSSRESPAVMGEARPVAWVVAGLGGVRLTTSAPFRRSPMVAKASWVASRMRGAERLSWGVATFAPPAVDAGLAAAS